MAAAKKTTQTKFKTNSGKGVTIVNNATCDLVVSGVKIKKGGSETVPDFDPETAKNKAFIETGMIKVS